MTPEYVRSLDKRLEAYRPDIRKKDMELDPNSQFAYLMPDLTLYPPVPTSAVKAGFIANKPVLCVELKVNS